MSTKTAHKVLFTGEHSHPELLARVADVNLPKLYGGLCECKASCIYSDKGPWSDKENTFNFQKIPETTTETC